MNRNSQPREPLAVITEEKLEVIRIWPTIQGEGPFAGLPAVFVRLAGCNMECPGCDTQYTEGRKWMTFDEIYDEIKKCQTRGFMLAQNIKDKSVVMMNQHEEITDLVVITGGEPFRQTSIAPFIDYLLQHWMEVQVETNGTLPYPRNDVPCEGLTIVCSPKGSKVHPKLLPEIAAYKYVLQAGRVDTDGLPLDALESGTRPARPPADHPKTEVYLQPMDEGDPNILKYNQRQVLESSLKFGYRAGLQLHKILGVD